MIQAAMTIEQYRRFEIIEKIIEEVLENNCFVDVVSKKLWKLIRKI
jgi:hypothetical protein